MLKNINRLIIIPLGFIPFICMGDNNSFNDPTPFIGVKAGFQWAQDSAHHFSDPSEIVGGISAGLRLPNNWSWDIGYQYHDNLYAPSTEINIKTWVADTAVRYDWYIDNRFSIYGRLGLSYWDIDKTMASSKNFTATGFSPLTEIGLNYDINQNIRLSAGYQYIDEIGDEVTGYYDSHILMTSLSYTFTPHQSVLNSGDISSTRPAIDVTKTLPASTETHFKNTTDVTNSVMPSTKKSILFETNSISLTYTRELNDLISILTKYPQSKISIIGHTDSTGTQIYNQKLSEQRAKTVEELLAQKGVNAKQMSSSGQGELSPISSNSTIEGRALNRRVELHIPEFDYQD